MITVQNSVSKEENFRNTLLQLSDLCQKALQNFQKVEIDPTFYSLGCTLYTQLEPISPTMSKGRVRIFYRGLNRNRTYISEEFANELIASLPYTPVKGIFDAEDVDYTDHGEKNSEGRIYGLVMAEPNFAWEKHIDSDGIIREYACADVLYYTALYPEAKLIPGSSQSMEIFPDTMEGEWGIWEDGEAYFHFKHGGLFGLQILGTKTEPCFEGAAFFSLQDNLTELVNYMDSLNTINKEEDAKMEHTLFRLSDSDKASLIATALNPNFTEEGNWELSSIVLDVYDDYALIGDVSSGGYKRAYYTKDGDNITIKEVVDVYVVDVTATEQAALEAMKAVGGTYEAANTAYVEATEQVSTLQASLDEANEKIVELESAKTATLDSTDDTTSSTDAPALDNSLVEKEAEWEAKLQEEVNKYTALESEKVRLEQANADLISDNEALKNFKVQIETEKKEAILSKYADHLSEEKYNEFKSNIEKYSIEDFDKEVVYASATSDPSIFNKTTDSTPAMYFKGDINTSGLSSMERLIEKHKRR